MRILDGPSALEVKAVDVDAEASAIRSPLSASSDASG